MSELEVPSGELLMERHRIVRKLGAGGMGAVYLATDTQLARDVAIKLCERGARDARSAARFANEARAAARVRSPHVVDVYDVGLLASGVPYLVMEYLEGETLEARLRRRGRIPLREALDLVGQALEGLAAAHAKGIVHRDLKPANLFVARDDAGVEIVKVLDFGISKMRPSLDAAPSSVTTGDALVGTPHYMAPEQLRNPKEADARSDLWAMGVILHELLTGARPFEGDTLGELMVAILERGPRALKDEWPEAPLAVERVLARCLAPNPAFRFADATALVEALAAIDPSMRARAERICLRVLADQPSPERVAMDLTAPPLVTSTTTMSVADAAASSRRARRRSAPLVVALCLAAFAIGAMALLGHPRGAQSAPAESHSASPALPPAASRPVALAPSTPLASPDAPAPPLAPKQPSPPGRPLRTSPAASTRAALERAASPSPSAGANGALILEVE